MKARNVTTTDIQEIVSKLNREKYMANILIQNISEVSKTTVSFKIRMFESRAEGTRKSWSGRRGPWACTHVFEDIMREVIEKGGEILIPKGSKGNEEGRQITISSDYELDNWVDNYNCSNIGSMMNVVYPEQLCNHCND